MATTLPAHNVSLATDLSSEVRGAGCIKRQGMLQIGSWVPAAAVKLRAIDAVHTRMGASDNLAQGRSTFLEELSETSAILATATESSLVVIDELGRGTSTHDGLAIAHATMHYLLRRSIPLLFVTHYPKVTRSAAPAAAALQISKHTCWVPLQLSLYSYIIDCKYHLRKYLPYMLMLYVLILDYEYQLLVGTQ